jgi:septal ring factor EnvC (AmiA/AmiB activator)
MHPRRPFSKIYPKVSTMPRQKTEAAHYLDMYKLTVEKKRLEQELQSIEARRQKLRTRLAEIEAQVEGLDDQAQNLRSPYPEDSLAPTSNIYLPQSPSQVAPQTAASFTMEYLEY